MAGSRWFPGPSAAPLPALQQAGWSHRRVCLVYLVANRAESVRRCWRVAGWLGRLAAAGGAGLGLWRSDRSWRCRFTAVSQADRLMGDALRLAFLAELLLQVPHQAVSGCA